MDRGKVLGIEPVVDLRVTVFAQNAGILRNIKPECHAMPCIAISVVLKCKEDKYG